MKKLISMLLIGSLALSITACGGKKEEPKSENVSTAQITEAQTALSSEQEVSPEPEYTCKPEVMEADFEDGVFQVYDIVFDIKKDWTLGEIAELFSNTPYELLYGHKKGEARSAYNSDALIQTGSEVQLRIKNNQDVFVFYGVANSGDDKNMTQISQCSYTGGALTIHEIEHFWTAQGIQPLVLDYQNIEEIITSDHLRFDDKTGNYIIDLYPEHELKCIFFVDKATAKINCFDMAFNKQ